jgi:hypothetical protein
LSLEVEHETVAGTEQVLLQVLDEYDTSLEKQELLSVIQFGIVLYGQEVVGPWREKARIYPDELADKMVTEHLLGIAERILAQVHLVESQDWFSAYEGFLDIGRRLFLTLLGLNRMWPFTDNPDFKGLKPFADELKWQPERFVDRLGQLLQSEATVSVLGFIGLFEEVIALVEMHLPTAEISSERELLNHVRRRTTRWSGRSLS